MSQSLNDTGALTQVEITAISRCIARNRPTEAERKAFFASMPARIDLWFAEYRVSQHATQMHAGDIAVVRQEEFLNPQT